MKLLFITLYFIVVAYMLLLSSFSWWQTLLYFLLMTFATVLVVGMNEVNKRSDSVNILEIFITKVFSEVPYKEEWTKDFPGKEFVRVEMEVDCYGCIERKIDVFEKEEWEKHKKQGYYMG